MYFRGNCSLYRNNDDDLLWKRSYLFLKFIEKINKNTFNRKTEARQKRIFQTLTKVNLQEVKVDS